MPFAHDHRELPARTAPQIDAVRRMLSRYRSATAPRRPRARTAGPATITSTPRTPQQRSR